MDENGEKSLGERIRLFFGFQKGGQSHDKNSLAPIYAGVVSTAVITFVEIYLLEGGVYQVTFLTGALGLAIYLFGAVLRTAARLQLGMLFTFQVKVMPEHKVKSDGLYSQMRHPGYTGLFIQVIGWVVFFQTWMGLLTFLFIFTPAMLYRIRVEEEMLRGYFGADYDEYAKRVKALVPGVF